MSITTIDRLVCLGWIFFWQPLFVLFGVPWLFEVCAPMLAVLLFVYGMFLPAIVWIFFVKPCLRGRARNQQEAVHE